MPYILLGEPAYESFGSALEGRGFIPVPLPMEKRLCKTVDTHADTLIFNHENTLIANRDYASGLPSHIAAGILRVSEAPTGGYPSDTVFNALTVGRFMFARMASLAPSVKSYAVSAGLIPVNVNQGYAKCSTLALSSSRAAVTADEGMAKAMESVGITVLRIAPGGIALKGCEYGFIGGASFVYEPKCCCSLSGHERYVYFFGNIRRHPDSEKILAFIHRFGYKPICLDGELCDFGGAVIIE